MRIGRFSFTGAITVIFFAVFFLVTCFRMTTYGVTLSGIAMLGVFGMYLTAAMLVLWITRERRNQEVPDRRKGEPRGDRRRRAE